QVLGKEYNGNMPAFGPNGLNLKPKQLAGVMTYIRQEWGNQAPDVTVEMAEGYIESYGARSAVWSASELLEGLGE
ncbi:MAG: cytochrome C, partial [Opitutales bacterium]